MSDRINNPGKNDRSLTVAALKNSDELMAKSKEADKNEATCSSQPTFEESLGRLQQVVADLEEGSLELGESIERFEQGMSLLRACYEMLEQAEQKIEVLTGIDADGNPLTADFDAAATVTQPQKAAGKRKRKAASGKPETPSDNNAGEEEPENRLF